MTGLPLTECSHQDLPRPILRLALWVALSSAASFAQAQTSNLLTEFPAGAQPVAAQALKDRLSDHVFKARLQDGSGWRLQFKGNYLFLNLSSGASDTGTWRTEDNKLCVEYQRFPSGCSEMRASEKEVFLKRSASGEVVRLEPND